MSLRKALDSLPDDRESASSVRQVIAFLSEHKGVEVTRARIERATGVPSTRLGVILETLSRCFVIDCGGDSPSETCSYRPSPVLALEVERYLRTSAGADIRLQQAAQRFRATHGTRR